MKLTIALAVLVTFTLCTQADTLTQAQIAQDLTQNSIVPMAPGVANELASNIMTAQADSGYSWETDSLSLSIQSVLRAISIMAPYLSEITDDPSSLVYEQSTIAIDDRVSVQFSCNGQTPCPGIDFGSVPVNGAIPTLFDNSGPMVSASEGSTIFMLATSLLVLFGFAKHLRFGARA